MKKLFVFAIAAAMVMSLAVAACAAGDSDWMINIKSGNTSMLKGYNSGFGFKTGASDDFVGGEDALLPPPSPGLDAVEIYSVLGGNKALVDRRSGNVIPSVWQIVVNPQANFAGDVIQLRGYNTAANDVADDLSDYAINLYQVDQFGGNRTLLWAFDPTVSSTSSSNYWSAEFTKGTLYFELEAAPVPEPGSMVALLSGMAGLAGFAIRRRK